MNEKEQKLYDAIMEGGYGMINTEDIMISGNIEVLKNLLLLPAPIRRKSREQHLEEIADE